MLSIKADVRVLGLRSEMIVAMLVVQDAFAELGDDCVVTSAAEGKHSPTSLHYAGAAMDFRTRTLPPERRDMLRRLVRERLPSDFDVILEPDHLHVEYQPRVVTG